MVVGMKTQTIIDALLELAIVPSFTRLGPLIRSRLFAWRAPRPGALTGRTALVTGATGGLGRATATGFARLGARVVLVGRDAGKLEALAADLREEHGEDRFPVVVADLSRLAGVRRAVSEVRAAETRLDIVVDNAGAIFPSRSTSDDGTESSLALMAVGPFALVGSLLPLLRASDDARVIAVTSGGQYTQPLDLDDLDGERLEYNGPRFYARAKRAQATLVREWARRLGPDGPTVVSMHPGWAETPGLSDSLPTFSKLLGPLLRSPDEGIDTIVWLATADRDEVEPGALYLDRRPRPFDRVPWTRLGAAERRRLWDAVVERTGGEDPVRAGTAG
jgi:dehydrogenase/reductase SDR family protein 12